MSIDTGESLEAARVLADVLRAGFFAVDEDRRVVMWDGFMTRHTGVPSSAALERDVFELLPDAPRAWLDRQIRAVLMTGAFAFSRWQDRPYLVRFAHDRPITGGVDAMRQDVTFFPVRSPDGSTRACGVAIFDVTENAVAQMALEAANAELAKATAELRDERATLTRVLDDLRRTQTRLMQAQKLESIGALAAGVAHEINTPVQYATDNVTFLRRSFGLLAEVAKAAVVVGPDHPDLARLLKKAKLDFVLPQVPKALDQACDGLHRIAEIVGAMKEFSHPASRDKEPVDLTHAITTTLAVARGEWKHVASVETSFDTSLPPVPVLRNELNQVILNLVVNAAHAIAEANAGSTRTGVIRVTTRSEETFAVIEVSDTGTGIPEAVVHRIFDPFFTTKPVGKGTGQGLAIAYNVVVEQHRGHLEVKTEVGAGSTFIVKLPLTSATPPEAAITPAVRGVIAGAQERV